MIATVTEPAEVGSRIRALREAMDLSLRDLAAKCRPPITKGAFHQRLARLLQLAGA